MHLSAATLWIGGLLSLGLVVWRDRGLRKTAFWRFSEIAGPLSRSSSRRAYMTYKRFPALHDLWSVGYGKLLLVKLSLVCLALLWGAFHHFVVRPRLGRPEVPAAGPRGRWRARRRSPSRSCFWPRSRRLRAADETDPAPTQALTARR